ncbi:MAG: hypothetical protein JRJ62_04775 [Deltaproteobacteria bacterium]|nr:hypothetical protein [Deltaproteobacteria bacterium]
MIAELREEIYTVLQTVDGIESHYMEADQDSDLATNTSVPYVIFSEIIDNHSRIDTNANEANVPVQFDFYHTNVADLESIYEATRTALLIRANYSFVGYNLLDLLQDFSTPVLQTEIKQISLQITYRLEKL